MKDNKQGKEAIRERSPKNTVWILILNPISKSNHVNLH